MKDPFPIKLKDSRLWERLLDLAKEADEYMCEILVWYRTVGVVLVENDKFGYTIKPLTLNTCSYGWQDEEEWQSEKKWLMPYWKTVAVLLKQLREEQEYVF